MPSLTPMYFLQGLFVAGATLRKGPRAVFRDLALRGLVDTSDRSGQVMQAAATAAPGMSLSCVSFTFPGSTQPAALLLLSPFCRWGPEVQGCVASMNQNWALTSGSLGTSEPDIGHELCKRGRGLFATWRRGLERGRYGGENRVFHLRKPGNTSSPSLEPHSPPSGWFWDGEPGGTSPPWILVPNTEPSPPPGPP